MIVIRKLSRRSVAFENKLRKAFSVILVIVKSPFSRQCSFLVAKICLPVGFLYSIAYFIELFSILFLKLTAEVVIYFSVDCEIIFHQVRRSWNKLCKLVLVHLYHLVRHLKVRVAHRIHFCGKAFRELICL